MNMNSFLAITLALVVSAFAKPSPDLVSDLVSSDEKCEDKSFSCGWMVQYCHKPTTQKKCPETCGLCRPQPSVGPPGTLPPTMEGCGVPEVQMSRVVAGKDAKRGAWPWQVLMMNNMRPQCGGTLVSSQWIVSAAHCVDSDWFYPERFTIRVGEHDWNRGKIEGSEADMAVERIIVHPKWNRGTMDYDVALFKLKKPARMTKYRQPACLASAELKPGTECFITGWGKIVNGGPMHKVLQQARMPIVASDVCEANNNKLGLGNITPRMLCAGDGGKTSISGCQGDSGGPFVCKVNGRWELHGDVSYGSPVCDSTAYTVFGKTLSFKSWILDTMRKYAN